MTRAVRSAILAALLVGALPLAFWCAAARADEDATATPPVPELKFFDGAGWVPLALHPCWVDGAGATPEGTATATLKSKLNGPKTYVVVSGTTSEVVLSNPKPRFRIASDRTGAFRLQLAEFEVRDENRATTIERTSGGTFFTKGVDLEVTKIQEGLWEIRPTKSLEPGEYALATSDKDPVADFTIVEKGY
jgi:cell division septation protein DedD